MSHQPALVRARMMTPRAAALAGILFSVLLIASIATALLSGANPFKMTSASDHIWSCC